MSRQKGGTSLPKSISKPVWLNWNNFTVKGKFHLSDFLNAFGPLYLLHRGLPIEIALGNTVSFPTVPFRALWNDFPLGFRKMQQIFVRILSQPFSPAWNHCWRPLYIIRVSLLPTLIGQMLQVLFWSRSDTPDLHYIPWKWAPNVPWTIWPAALGFAGSHPF